MIESVEIQNFKNIRNQRIELEPLTVFVGPNGSGKTSVLEAVETTVHTARLAPRKFYPKGKHARDLYTRDGIGNQTFTCRSQAGELKLVASEGNAGIPGVSPSDWKFTITPDNKAVLDSILSEVYPLAALRLDAVRLARPSYSDHDPPRLEGNGKGLASVMAYMALNDPDAFNEVIFYMHNLIPQFRRIRFRRAAIKRMEKELLRVGDESVERRTSRVYWGEEILFDFAKALDVPAHAVSEGTLYLLGLLGVLLGPSPPKVLLMDDIERGLHPLAQKSLLDVLREVMQRFPDLQILATAHSPYLLDYLRPEEVRLMTIDEDGFSVCGRLKDHPQFDTWKDEMAPGEMWSLFGEKWLVQGGAR